MLNLIEHGDLCEIDITDLMVKGERLNGERFGRRLRKSKYLFSSKSVYLLPFTVYRKLPFTDIAMEKLTTLIIDDELKGRNLLNELVKRYCPDVEVLGLAQSATEAIS